MNEKAVASANGWPADGAALLDELAVFIRRHVVLSEVQAAVVALWIVHSWAIDAADTTPYLHISAPTKRSGKSRLLDVLEVLVRKPLKAGGATEAALFRGIADRTPTLLFDEIDSIFGPKARDHEDLRALLNNGYRRGTPVLRCVGEGTKQTATEFDVFCVKALCGIGRLPDTLADRALPILLKRKAKSETVERFRYKHAQAAAAGLRERAEGWAEMHLDRLAEATPELPDELDDRAQDVSEPLLAIADRAGGDWPARARRALVAVRGGTDQELHDDDAGVRLVADIQRALG
ncbi:MAG TPA: DUF3631 domain-containing protein, partial [Plantibacter sp.]|uniref:DUF3631 domain-containing protein n=1 Tax=Plantibacter sp. TaxID=1871045 RepID=UPI002C93BBA4|nr:DUF3631 domain-containing protein [Plantibacter sp.]